MLKTPSADPSATRSPETESAGWDRIGITLLGGDPDEGLTRSDCQRLNALAGTDPRRLSDAELGELAELRARHREERAACKRLAREVARRSREQWGSIQAEIGRLPRAQQRRFDPLTSRECRAELRRISTVTRTAGRTPRKAAARTRGSRRQTASTSSRGDPDDGEPEPPGLKLWRHPDLGPVTPALYRLLLREARS